MRVLCLTQDFPPNQGGISVFLHNLCDQLCRFGNQVDVLTRACNGCEKDDAHLPYRVYRYNTTKRLSSIVPLTHTLALHRKHRYDLLFIGHFMTTHALGALALRRLYAVPYVILCHGNDLRYCLGMNVDGMVARLLVRDATLMLANSRFTAERIRRQASYGRPIEVLNPGVDPRHFHPKVSTAEVRQKYNLDRGQTLLTVGRLVERKNIEGMLCALPQVVEQIPNLLYLIVGDGEEREQLETLSEQLGLGPYVRFLGHVEGDLLPALYCASDLFVMASFEQKNGQDYEGFGIVFSEANACGLPVIGGRSGGMTDAVVDGETGLLVDPQNTDEIAAAIVRLLTDRDLACRLGENGRRRVVQELTWEKVTARLVEYFASIGVCTA